MSFTTNEFNLVNIPFGVGENNNEKSSSRDPFECRLNFLQEIIAIIYPKSSPYKALLLSQAILSPAALYRTAQPQQPCSKVSVCVRAHKCIINGQKKGGKLLKDASGVGSFQKQVENKKCFHDSLFFFQAGELKLASFILKMWEREAGDLICTCSRNIRERSSQNDQVD